MPQKSTAAKTRKSPWSKANPKKKQGRATKHLTAQQKSKAKASARAGGRTYPNLVDNMNAAKKSRSAKS